MNAAQLRQWWNSVQPGHRVSLRLDVPTALVPASNTPAVRNLPAKP
jgi:hypothetical protein